MQSKFNQQPKLIMKIVSVIFIIALLAACNSTTGEIAPTDSAFKTVVPQTPFINAEEYVGTMPCADCEGIDVSLQLNKNSSYVMNYVYKGNHDDSSSSSFKDTGTWSMHGSDTLYLSGKNQTKYIKTNSTLTQLDGDGKVITGNSASMFVLHKK